jgi:hypothetical protein
VYVSSDGQTWERVGEDLSGWTGRISLAVQPDHPEVVYMLTSQGDVFRLDRRENVWRAAGGVPPDLLRNQGWYDLSIAVAPDNVNRIYLGGSAYFCD